MNIVYWVVVGLIAGVLAKLITPGTDREPKGCLMTSLLGIGGSVVTGFLMEILFRNDRQGGFIPTIFGATIGAIILILAFRKFWK